MVKPRHDIAVLLKNTQNIAIFDPCNKAAKGGNPENYSNPEFISGYLLIDAETSPR
ncbi:MULTISPECIES: hypothetical protein [unclassified Rickettsia]|uniref:hypothetical protein n=1 Tax=unclassified Rickettsia TaxID=114295 RepID=UPI003132D957